MHLQNNGNVWEDPMIQSSLIYEVCAPVVAFVYVLILRMFVFLVSILLCIKVENFDIILKDSSFQLWYNLLHVVWYCQCFVLAFLCFYPILLALYTTCNEVLQVFTWCTFWKIGPYYLYINIFEVHVFQMANSGLQYKMQLRSIVGLHDKRTSSWWFVGTIIEATHLRILRLEICSLYPLLAGGYCVFLLYIAMLFAPKW